MKLVDDDGKDVEQGEVGEIAIKGENVMKGYWGKEEETEEAIPDGWFLSGDMAKQDEDGYFFIVDRKKDLIIRGGYNVYPREVEEALYEHDAVAEVAVIGIPRRRPRRGGRRRRRAQVRREGRRGGAAGLRQGAAGGVQVPARRSGSSTSCPRDRPARSCAARSAHPTRGGRQVSAATKAEARMHEADEDAQATTDELATPLDLLLSDATSSPLRRFVPGMSGVRFTAGLARHPVPRAPGARSGWPPSWPRSGVGRSEIDAAREGPPLRRGGLGQEPAPPAHPADLPRRRRGRARAGRRRRPRLGRRPADGLHRRQPRRGLRPEQQPVPEPEGAQAASSTPAAATWSRAADASSATSPRAPRVPSMVEPDAFEVGVDIAVTAGRGGAAHRRLRADPVHPADAQGARGPAADRAADDQQVLRDRPRRAAQPGRAPRRRRPAGLLHLLAQPRRPARRLGPRHLRPGDHRGDGRRRSRSRARTRSRCSASARAG